jgi:hypothetical protein
MACVMFAVPWHLVVMEKWTSAEHAFVIKVYYKN